MLFKFYTFMCDFFPQGLANNLSHFNGDEVMEQLVHRDETPISRDDRPEADRPHMGVDRLQADTIVSDEDKSSQEPALPPAISASNIHELRHRLELHDSSSAAEQWLF